MNPDDRYIGNWGDTHIFYCGMTFLREQALFLSQTTSGPQVPESSKKPSACYRFAASDCYPHQCFSSSIMRHFALICDNIYKLLHP